MLPRPCQRSPERQTPAAAIAHNELVGVEVGQLSGLVADDHESIDITRSMPPELLDHHLHRPGRRDREQGADESEELDAEEHAQDDGKRVHLDRWSRARW